MYLIEISTVPLILSDINRKAGAYNRKLFSRDIWYIRDKRPNEDKLTKVDIALPAFLSSIHSTLDLAGRILKAPAGINCEIACLNEATNAWLAGQSPNLPSKPHRQRAWDTIASVTTLQTLVEPSTGRDRARLLAVSKPESGYWLHAYPSPNTVTFIDPNTLGIAVGLQLGVGICASHNCVSCGAPVDGLSCSSGAGRLTRHAAQNVILSLSLIHPPPPHQQPRHTHHKRAEVHVVARLQLEHPQRVSALPADVFHHICDCDSVMQTRHIQCRVRCGRPDL
ncbi:hypothetical protein MSG28_009267 [Choristoneura fumiferana]|uniref:Uncharacterized protein n=1 Tax=Choristoneura fumiferana TaxID=7141 RepID=A0ACC0KXH9_CHOFU|nr:hypothetical protein MSG28_009267 [Choristoneura fumiferana]